MITLCGFAVSNYFNVVKQVLLEKQIPYTEERAMTRSKDESVLSASPLGKVPFIRTAQGPLCETAVILDYLEAQYPAHPLVPADAFAAAKVRELCTFINLHLELVARDLYPAVFFGGSVSDEQKEKTRKQLVRNIEAFKRLVKFAPYVGGDSFTLADCVAFNNLPLVGMASKAAYGEDLLLAAGVDYKTYMKLVGERASSQQVVTERKAEMARPKD
jgi:glutathione S-transferase